MVEQLVEGNSGTAGCWLSWLGKRNKWMVGGAASWKGAGRLDGGAFGWEREGRLDGGGWRCW